MKIADVFRLGCALLVLLSTPLAAQSIVLISDLNGRYGSAAYASRITDAINAAVSMKPDLVISTGDMVAGQRQPLLDSDALDTMWRGFNAVVTDPLSRAGIPLAVTPGNHDGSAFPDFVLEQQHFDAQWQSRVPELEILPGSEWPRRYGARMGTALLLAFDGTRPGKLPETERLFLEGMLRSHASGVSLTIVFSHLPMWPLAKGREHEIIDDPELLSLLHRSGVDVYASGHHHVFFAGTDAAGMVHLGVGALGGNARAFTGTRRVQPYSFAILSQAQGRLTVASAAAPDFTDDVPATGMPSALEGPLGTLRRITGPVPLRP